MDHHLRTLISDESHKILDDILLAFGKLKYFNQNFDNDRPYYSEIRHKNTAWLPSTEFNYFLRNILILLLCVDDEFNEKLLLEFSLMDESDQRLLFCKGYLITDEQTSL